MDRAGDKRLAALLRRFRTRRIGVVGDFMLDHFIRGSVTRTSPEAPVPVVRVDRPETFHLGGAGNVAANLGALGCRPAVFGLVGKDAQGEIVRKELRQLGAAGEGLLVTPGRHTTVKTRVIAEHQHVVRADWEQTDPVPRAVERRLLAAFRRAAPRLDGVVVSDYDKGVVTESLLAALLAECAGRALPVLMDLKKARRINGQLSLLLVNERRAEEVTGLALDDVKTLSVAGRRLMAQFPCSILIVTRGPKGMAVFEEDGEQALAAVRTKPWEVFDVTGAGDTVMATLALALVSGATPVEAAHLANAAAGVVVGKLGTAVCSSQELLARLK